VLAVALFLLVFCSLMVLPTMALLLFLRWGVTSKGLYHKDLLGDQG
jgi:hypothetical protein